MMTNFLLDNAKLPACLRGSMGGGMDNRSQGTRYPLAIISCCLSHVCLCVCVVCSRVCSDESQDGGEWGGAGRISFPGMPSSEENRRWTSRSLPCPCRSFRADAAEMRAGVSQVGSSYLTAFPMLIPIPNGVRPKKEEGGYRLRSQTTNSLGNYMLGYSAAILFSSLRLTFEVLLCSRYLGKVHGTSLP